MCVEWWIRWEAVVLDVGLYDLLMGASGAMYRGMAAARRAEGEAGVGEVPPLLLLRGGLAESAGWYLVQAAEFAPEPLTVAGLRVRDVYAAERTVRALLELMMSEGWLDRDAEERYALTGAGRAVLDRNAARRARLSAGLALLPGDELARLAGWFDGLIAASLASGSPPGTWCLAHSRNRAPGADAPVILRVAQAFDDFNAFRDDAHMAAWGPLGVGGHAWEVFDTVCQGEVATAGAIKRRLAHRGYARYETAAALAGLAERGWVVAAGEAGGFGVTEEGRAIRRRVEELTDRYFYAPWAGLSDGEIEEMRGMLVRMRDGSNE